MASTSEIRPAIKLKKQKKPVNHSLPQTATDLDVILSETAPVELILQEEDFGVSSKR